MPYFIRLFVYLYRIDTANSNQFKAENPVTHSEDIRMLPEPRYDVSYRQEL